MTKISTVLILSSLFFYIPSAFAVSENTEYYKHDSSISTSAVNTLSGSKSFGHLLSSNNNTLKKGRVSIGTLYAGVGITDNITIATSPFIWQSFQMYNAYIRSAARISKNEDLGFDVGYFKTNKSNSYWSEKWYSCSEEQSDLFHCDSGTYNTKGNRIFEMEAWTTKLTYGRKINSFYKSNVTASYFYYKDDYQPFSFRMDPQNDDKFSLNLTSLHEFKFSEEFYINYEFGIWGINYVDPYIHTGTTLNWQKDNYLVGLGLTTTFSPTFPDEKVKTFEAGGYNSKASLHPEIQLQMFF